MITTYITATDSGARIRELPAEITDKLVRIKVNQILADASKMRAFAKKPIEQIIFGDAFFSEQFVKHGMLLEGKTRFGFYTYKNSDETFEAYLFPLQESNPPFTDNVRFVLLTRAHEQAHQSSNRKQPATECYCQLVPDAELRMKLECVIIGTLDENDFYD